MEPRLILLDLESLPDLMEILKIYPSLSDYPGRTLRAQITSIISFAWKVYGDPNPPKAVAAWDYPGWQTNVNDDFELCKSIYEILKNADAVISFNGKKFDWKFIQTRLLMHGLPPLAKTPHIDCCQLAKSNLLLYNNRLANVSQVLTDQEKQEHEGWNLWVRTWHRDPEAMKEMISYNIQDVVALEAVFKVLRPFATSIPNHNLFSTGEQRLCPNCGSSRITCNGAWRTQTMNYKRYVCQDCLSYSRTDSTDRIVRKI